jgi:S-adenosylmethionine hydrolase
LRVDHFGNLVTNIDQHALAEFGNDVVIRVGAATIPRIARTYTEAAEGALCALVGSTDRLEISINGGSAAATLGAQRGTAVHVRPRSGA